MQWWSIEGEETIQEIARHLGLKFAEQELPAYIHDGPPGASSDPINISVKSALPLEHVLVHELIHHLLSFNNQRYDEDVDSPKLYPTEEPGVAIHVIVHAIHQWYCSTHGQDDLIVQDKQVSLSAPIYRRAWEIVKQEGYQEVIKKFKEKIK